ncbi:Hsp20/alpha crystallin family protein [Sphingobacterium sp. ML3W]|uniref:Hsp20/alpha crystallin family protein n=1 Tax=Sphingobacterium sp. ML3W TaxID=1538644 RepID=UPI00249A1C8C|nr:Hsp20/alpha crystallin family protein [Sphingobacterium sp. ML3W]WFA80803.1 Hsp20/alpha crystallin family protein [Sphingobacterium sp. ML3W]
MKTTETPDQLVQSSLVSQIEDFWSKDELTGALKKKEPTINIIEKNGVYKLRVLAPGFKKRDFRVAVEDRSLIISAEHSVEKKEENENYVRKEFSANSFSRSFHLPDNVTLDNIKATYKDGLLNITINKTNPEEQEVKDIKVR